MAGGEPCIIHRHGRSEPDDEKARWTEALRRHLKTAKALRLQANQAPATARKRLLLREWQAARLARSYSDLLASERFGQDRCSSLL